MHASYKQNAQGTDSLLVDTVTLARVVCSFQLCDISSLELRPSIWIMREPFAKIVAGCNLFQPEIYPCFRFGEPPRPEPIDEDPLAIVFAGLNINTLYPDHSLSHTHFQC